MKSDARLVEYVEHSDQSRTDLRCKPDSLRLAARQRSRASAQRQVIKTNVHKELEPCLYLLDNLASNHRVFLRKVDVLDELKCLANRHIRKLGYILITDRNRQNLWLQTLATAIRASLYGHVFFHFVLEILRRRIAISPLDIVNRTLEGSVLMRNRASAPAHVVVNEVSVASSVVKLLAEFLRHILEWNG